MTDYRDPNNRDPNYRDPTYRDPARPDYRDLDTPARAWSNATWGWIAGIAVVILVLIFAFSGGSERTANNEANPPATTGQGTTQTPSGQINSGAPTSRPAPAPAPSTK
jgi:hypothetical protein